MIFSRTARRLMEGWAYVRKQRLEDTPKAASEADAATASMPAPVEA